MKENKGMTRLISLQVPSETLKQDLDNFRQKALDFGASLAQIIPAQWAEVDERVRLKCAIPLCPNYGRNIYCPPHGFEPEFMRKALSRYSWAILFALDVIPAEEFADHTLHHKVGINWMKKTIEIAGRVETLAFSNGYYLALGLCQASCLETLCNQERCLSLDGGKCPYPLKARPSIEGLGIDVFALVTKARWDIYPIYRSIDPKLVPRALSVGIVFVC